jgi:signal transduction histidine kinase
MLSDKEEKKVLILDEQKQFGKYFSELLEKFLISVEVFYTVKQVQKYLVREENRADLIITDVFSDKNRFLDFLKTIQFHDQTRYTPIMGVTSTETEDYEFFLSYSYEHNMDDFIFYPVDPKEFLMRVIRLLHLKETYSQLRDRLKESDQLIFNLDQKLEDISSIYKKMEEQTKIQKKQSRKQKENFYSMVHDIKSPLNNILLAMDMILYSENDARELRDLVLTSRDTVNRVFEMIDHFLKQLKKRKLKERIELELLNPAYVFEIVMREFYPRANRKGINMVLKLEEESKNVLWDKAQMIRVVSNVLDNAIKHSDPGQCINVYFSQNEIHSFILIEDQGRGIPPEQLDRIFEMYYQADAQQEGTGIGLAWTKKILEKHLGKLEVESVPGQGTKVKMILPNYPEVAKK